MKQEPYRQQLPALKLSIERYTDAVPLDGGWYLLQAGEQLGRFRSLKAAKAAWDVVVKESDWHPEKHQLDPSELIRREQVERWARNRGG